VTDVSNLDPLARRISDKSPNIKAYATHQAAVTRSQEDDIRSLLARVQALEHTTPPPTPGALLHTHRLSIPAGGTHVWAKNASRTAPILGNQPRVIEWAATGGEHLYAGRECWLLMSFRPIAGRNPGRMFDWHTTPMTGGWTPDGPASAVAAVAIDWRGSSTYEGAGGLHLILQPAAAPTHFQILSAAEMDKALADQSWVDLTMHLTIGRPGAVRIWANGETIPRVHVTGKHTHWANQTGFGFWEGLYVSEGAPESQYVELMPTRIGRTLDEALRDGVDWPIEMEYELLGSTGFWHEVVEPRSTGDVRVPTGVS